MAPETASRHVPLVLCALLHLVGSLHLRGTEEVVFLTFASSSSNSRIPVPGVPGISWYNAGLGRQWTGFESKLQGFLDGARKMPPNALVVVSDSFDVMFGGCSRLQLLQRYQQAVARGGGAPIVYGAQMRLWPSDTLRFSRYSDPLFVKRRGASNFASLYGEYWSPDANTADMCSRLVGICPSGTSGKNEFLNSGFIMGPAKDLEQAFEMQLALLQNQTAKKDDQEAAAEYMFKYPAHVTLDYDGGLVADLVGTKAGWLTARDGKVWNQILDQPQCFVHGNGGGCRYMHELLRKLNSSQELKLPECHHNYERKTPVADDSSHKQEMQELLKQKGV